MAHAQTRRNARGSAKDVVSPMRFNVKLAAAATAPHSLTATRGILSVTRVFPDEDDDELARLYLIEVHSTAVSVVLARLRQDPSVEFVEEAPRRKLIK